jgi:hypothetical protein
LQRKQSVQIILKAENIMTTDLCLPQYLRRDDRYYLDSKGIYKELITELRKVRYLPIEAHMVLNYASFLCDSYLQGGIELANITSYEIEDEVTLVQKDTKLVVVCTIALILVIGNGKVDAKEVLRAYVKYTYENLLSLSREMCNLFGHLEQLIVKARRHPEQLQPVFETESETVKVKKNKNGHVTQTIILNGPNTSLTVTINDGEVLSSLSPIGVESSVNSQDDEISAEEKIEVFDAMCDRLRGLEKVCDYDRICGALKSALGLNLGSKKEYVQIQKNIWIILTKKRPKCEKEKGELYFSHTFLNIVGYLYSEGKITGKKSDIIECLYPGVTNSKKPGMIKCLERNIKVAFPEGTDEMFGFYFGNL